MKSRYWSVVFWLVYGLFLFFFFPSWAKAWGPGAHLECSDFLLKNLVLLAPVIRKLMKAHPFAFIYGSVCPDMVLGKRFMNPQHNNHNWQVSERLLQNASTPREQAFALGYLSHLAADIVAHNLFIPDQLLRHYDRRYRNHVMQELIFDARLGEEIWRTAREVARRPFPECEALLHRTLTHTPLPQRVNLRLFRSGVLLVRLGGWQRIIKRLYRRWASELPQPAMAPYLAAMHQTVIAYLNHLAPRLLAPASPISPLDPSPLTAEATEGSPSWSPTHLSPSGASILPVAHYLRHTLKRLDRHQELDPLRHFSLITAFNEWRDQALALSSLIPLSQTG